MCDAKDLIRYARHRERCYRATKNYNMAYAKAVTKIIRTASIYRDKGTGPWIRNIINEITLILPSQESRFTEQRKKILNIISPYY